MKTFTKAALLLCFISFIGCTKDTKNEVLVLGTIHSGHYTEKEFDLDILTKLIKEINPDIILTEIPPNRFQEAMDGFKRDDSVSEPRVIRFPEYKDVIFPLSKTMNFEMIPTAGWTRPMALERQKKLRAISQDSTRQEDWKAYVNANRKSDSLMKISGRNGNDPYFIHTNTYDSIYNISLETYNKLFNVELGLGGWNNINIAHYWNIHKALEKYKNQGKRVLITYGAGHKGWFLKELRLRDDIKLLEMKPFLDKIATPKEEKKEAVSMKKDHQLNTVSKNVDQITIDGIANEKTWENSSWLPINQVWLGNPVDKSDFSGRYKLSWSKEALYVLVEVQDDVLRDEFENPLERWWDEDCVEIFIDEDNSGGGHQFDHNAFAYHIDTKGNVVDIIAENEPRLFNDHIESKRITSENTSTWEFKIALFPDSFEYGKSNQKVTLSKGKKVGFAIAYCDNDKSEHRENFIGSVTVQGNDKDRGWKDADIFGTIELKE